MNNPLWPTGHHEIGFMLFPDDGPSHVEVSADFIAGQWAIGVEIYPVEDLVDKANPSQWDKDIQSVIPESGFNMTLTQTRDLIALFTAAVEHVELLVEDGLDG